MQTKKIKKAEEALDCLNNDLKGLCDYYSNSIGSTYSVQVIKAFCEAIICEANTYMKLDK